MSDAEKIALLREALTDVLADIADFEKINNLFPNHGYKDCWHSVTNAKAALAATEPAPVASGQDADWEIIHAALERTFARPEADYIFSALDRLRNAVREEPVFWIDDYGRKRKPNGDVIEGAAPVPHDAVVPEGWQCVPPHPSQNMVDAGYGKITIQIEDNGNDLFSAYEAMLKAAPPATLETASAVRERALEEMAQIFDKKRGIIKGSTAAMQIRALKVKP